MQYGFLKIASTVIPAAAGIVKIVPTTTAIVQIGTTAATTATATAIATAIVQIGATATATAIVTIRAAAAIVTAA